MSVVFFLTPGCFAGVRAFTASDLHYPADKSGKSAAVNRIPPESLSSHIAKCTARFPSA